MSGTTDCPRLPQKRVNRGYLTQDINGGPLASHELYDEGITKEISARSG